MARNETRANERPLSIEYIYTSDESPMNTIKTFVEEHFYLEYLKYEKYADWDKCFISPNNVLHWARNEKHLDSPYILE